MSQDIHTPRHQDDVQVLDPLAFPLAGSRLIEASAGTGKTFTIAALYVRLVLGHGGEQGFGRALMPPEILVVTFTEAATKELRERIRDRLGQASRCFRPGSEGANGAPPDDFLSGLRASYPPEQWAACANRLQLAAEWMDEAAVATIHAWCNRMLREHAFDSHSLFTQTLETDQSALMAEVVRDYWRSFLVPLDAGDATELAGWWTAPKALQDQLNKLVVHAGLLAPADEPGIELARARAERARMLEALKAPWAQWVDELQVLLDSARDAGCLNGQKLKKNNYDDWLKAIALWRDDPGQLAPALSAAALARLSPGGLAEVWKTEPKPRHPALEALQALEAALAALPHAREAVLRHAARWVAARFGGEQARRAQMGFDDLLAGLDRALAGVNGGRLAEIIRCQFPVALIDEFQDTDPVQYRIFDAVYRVADNAPDAGLIMIGDPKQAIYAFRGADIHTYLAARHACAGRLFTLKRNFRSTAAMVAAANRCFELAEGRSAGAGAFLFRTPYGNPVPFVAAEANGRKEYLRVAGRAQPALTTWLLSGEGGETIGKTNYRAAMARSCATAIVALLNQAAAGRAGFVRDGPVSPLRPSDFAVLVNSRTEADEVRAALQQRGVRSVYLSDGDSVFASAEAVEMQLWLAACAEPDEARLLRAALATTTLGLSWTALDALNHDERAWEARVLQFRVYRELWRRQGVLPMVRRLLGDFSVPARLLAGLRGGSASREGGERVLTNLLHLAELLQQASVLLDGEHALVRYLAQQRLEAGQGAGGDTQQLRLESDANLVQVVTIHKSKGLEYPLVFLPFTCGYRETTRDDLPFKFHDDAGHLRLALEADEDVIARVERERLGEDLRKLYVALTRARHATWLGVAPLAALEKSALGYLLSGEEPIEPGAVPDLLARLRGGIPDIEVAAAPLPNLEAVVDTQGAIRMGAALQPLRSVREHWWIASFSALGMREQVGGPVGSPVPDTPAEDVFREHLDEASRESAPEPAVTDEPGAGRVATADDGPAGARSPRLHAFPRGAAVGSFLHELLEWAAREGFGCVADDPQRVRDTIARRAKLRGWVHWVDDLSAWFQHFITVPISLPGAARVPLAGLSQAVPEMEFWIAAAAVDVERLDRLVCAHTLAGAPRPALAPNQLNGMLKGFIDLVFEHEGRYYVADYKSNWLGPDDAAYEPGAMRAAILAARYELQYVLYLFALHRLLRARLPDYDYDRHVGGAVYLFMRGSASAGQGVHIERPGRALFEALDSIFAADPVEARP